MVLLKNKITEFKQKKLKQRKTLLKVAKELFSELGYNDFSIRTLMRGVKMPTTNFYYFFTSKRELYFALRILEYERITSSIQSIIKLDERKDYFKLIKDIFMVFLVIANKNYKYFDMIFDASFHNPGELGHYEKIYREKRFDFIFIIRDFFEEGIKENKLRAVEPINLTFIMWTKIKGIAKDYNELSTSELELKEIINAEEYKKDAITEFDNWLKTLII